MPTIYYIQPLSSSISYLILAVNEYEYSVELTTGYLGSKQSTHIVRKASLRQIPFLVHEMVERYGDNFTLVESAVYEKYKRAYDLAGMNTLLTPYFRQDAVKRTDCPMIGDIDYQVTVGVATRRRELLHIGMNFEIILTEASLGISRFEGQPPVPVLESDPSYELLSKFGAAGLILLT